MTDPLAEALRRWWGYDSFRPVQREAMASVLEHRDSVVVLPTGGGKSLCYQAPAMCLDGMAVIVSPLIALMKDQVDGLRNLGIPAEAINSSLVPSEKQRIARAIRSGETRILYVTPERLVNDRFIRFLQERPLSFIAVDEAHCISQWGHDFRPDYRNLGRLREVFPETGIHAYTATATPRVREDIAVQLGLRNAAFHTGCFDRPNLTYRVNTRDDLLAQVDEVLDRHADASGIIYCIRRRDVDDLCAALAQRGHRPLPYHAGLDDRVRKENQEAFIREQADIMVATVAFGMGIDKPNVRFVLHAGMPKSIEHYQQESGRAGRDGLPSECILLYSGSDFMVWKRMLGKAEAGVDGAALDKLEDMYRYCRNAMCRHRALAQYFGEKGLEPPCGACDHCLGEAECHPESAEIAGDVLGLVQDLDQAYGIVYVARLLAGEKDERSRRKQHHKLPRFGALRAKGFNTVRDWCRELIDQGFLEEVGDYRVLHASGKALDWLGGTDGQAPALRPEQGRDSARARKAKAKRVSVTKDHPSVHEGLFERLRHLRRELAEEEGIPPYQVFGDATLLAMAAVRPSSLDGFSRLHGVGDRKLERYGEPFVAVVGKYCADEGLPVDVAVADAGFTRTAPAKKRGPSPRRLAMVDVAHEHFRHGAGVAEVAEIMERSPSTVAGYLEELFISGKITDPSPWLDPELQPRIEAAMETHGHQRLRVLFDHFDGAVPYESLRLARAVYLQKHPAPPGDDFA